MYAQIIDKCEPRTPLYCFVYSADSHINLNRKSGSCTQFGIYWSIWNEAFQYLYNKMFPILGTWIPDCVFFLKILPGPIELNQIKSIITGQYKKLVNLIEVWSVIMSGQFPVCVPSTLILLIPQLSLKHFSISCYDATVMWDTDQWQNLHDSWIYYCFRNIVLNIHMILKNISCILYCSMKM